MFKKFSNGFRMPSGEVKETAEILSARDKLSVDSTINEVLALYVSLKNMDIILESTPLIGSSSYFLFKEYIKKPVREIPQYVLEQIKTDLEQNRISLLKSESGHLKNKLMQLIDAQLLALRSSVPAAVKR